MAHKRAFPWTLCAVLVWIGIWQLAAGLVNRDLLLPIPTPLGTARALIHLMADRSFFHAAGMSMLRILVGFAAAFLLGTLLAALTVRFRVMRLFFAPLLSLIRAVPVASFTILVFLWVSRANIPPVITFFTVLPMIWATIENGLRHADGGLVEMARVFGMSRAGIWREILLPGIRPFFAAAVSNGLGFAWKSGVAAEVICRTADSLGDRLWMAKSAVDYEEVFAVTLVIVLLSAAASAVAGRLLGTSEGQGTAWRQ